MMLVHLVITDFAIIKHLDLSLRAGLNILSGETGAGKSIIINAINLILGGRSTADLIRTGCTEAVVEGLFVLPQAPGLVDLLEEAGISFDGELLIKRSISREGRNRVFINGSLATLQTLSRLGPRLLSISGQYAHQLLLRPENHLYLLDEFSGLSAERVALGMLFDRHHALKGEISSLEAEIRSQKEREELSRFQIREIEMAGPVPGEDDLLEEEMRRLQHAEELLEIAATGYQILYEDQNSALSSVAVCVKTLEKGSRIAPELASVKASLSDIEAQIEDLSFALRDFRESVQVDPQRLNQVVERLDLLKKLKRKYGATIEDILRFKETLASTMFDLEGKVQDLGRLNHELAEMASELLEKAETLSQNRRNGAEDFRRAVEMELRQLHMKDTRFSVAFKGHREEEGLPVEAIVEDMRPDGLDHVEFMISPNPGEELKPLSKIASGGELSRIMLAVRTILSRSASVETVIFDEVDAGISGATAEVVGEKIAALALYHQIVCITHLPQIASQGTTHFVVKKEVMEGRTEAAITELSPEARTREIARLLGGRRITSRALAHAREMLQRGTHPKEDSGKLKRARPKASPGRNARH
jgi:DNA repair protein RecN (Recombination protein N)